VIEIGDLSKITSANKVIKGKTMGKDKIDEVELQKNRMQKMLAIGQVFRPSAPVNTYTLFAGRRKQLQNIISVLSQAGQHAIIYGERGVGKTSLTNILSEIFRDETNQSWPYVRINCDGQDTFKSIWQKIFRELQIITQKTGVGFVPSTQQKLISLNDFLSDSPQPDEIRYWLQQFGGLSIIVIDEIDRIIDKQTATLLADTIKTLSDHALETKIILVGVADSVDDLISEHKSVERALVQILMPRMSVSELTEIIDKGLSVLEMTIEEQAKQQIATLSQGLPHYTHLLGLYSAQSACQKDSLKIDLDDVQVAIRQAVETIQQSILSDYHKAVSSSRKTIYAQALLACALANKNDLGYFSATDVRAPLAKITGKPYDINAFSQHLNAFCDTPRGPTLQKSGFVRRFKFRFINPLLQPYVILHGLAKGLIDEKTLAEVQ